MSNLKRVPTRGFTLIEIVVSVGIFSLVMLVVTAAYLTLMTLDREARTTNEIVANLAFAVDSMGRNIRTGTTYSCAGAGNGTCSQFSFIDSQGQTVTYLLKGNSIGQCTNGGCTSSNAISLTDPRITITSLVFYVRGVGTGDNSEPQVTMSVRGTMQAQRGRTIDFSVQTGATQRYIEL